MKIGPGAWPSGAFTILVLLGSKSTLSAWRRALWCIQVLLGVAAASETICAKYQKLCEEMNFEDAKKSLHEGRGNLARAMCLDEFRKEIDQLEQHIVQAQLDNEMEQARCRYLAAGDNDAVIRIFVVALAAAIGGGGGDADPGGCQWGEHDDDAAARR
eukprot:1033509-Rhodomonas_salina.2